MRQGFRKACEYTQLQIFLGTAILVLCLMVWPFQVFGYSDYSGYQKTEPEYTGAVTMEEIVLQQFMPLGAHIQDIRIECKIENVHMQDRVFVTIYDSKFDIIYQEVWYFTDIQTLGYIQLEPNMDVNIEDVYYIGLNVHFDSEGTLQIPYADQSILMQAECGVLNYATQSYLEKSMFVEFHYTEEFSAGLKVLCVIGIFLGGVFLYIAIVFLNEKLKVCRKKEKIQKIALIVLAIIITFSISMCFYQMCVKRVFGGEIWDHIVYAGACIVVLILGIYAYCRVWKRLGWQKAQDADEISWKSICTKNVQTWVNYLQIVCIVFLFWAGVEYVNAPIQWKQDLARNWLYFLFGLLVLLTSSWRKILNICTVLFCISMIPIGMVYSHLQGVENHAPEVSCMMVLVFTVWGIVLINTIRNWKRIKNQKSSVLLAICWILICVCMVLNRYDKEWPVFMAVSFSLFYLQSYTDSQRKQLVHNFLNAILVHFFILVLMCWLHRPYHYYQFNRYPMWFHTVATTGMYLVMVEAVALLRLFIKIHDTKSIWLGPWKEWIVNASVLSYICLTAARTAIIAVLGMYLILAIGALIVYRLKIKYYLMVVGVNILSLVALLSVVYTTTRCIPAVVNDPVYFNEAEKFDYAIRKGEELNSSKYMNIRALVRMWAVRFGVSEVFITNYLEEEVTGGEKLKIIAELAANEVRGIDNSQSREVIGINELSNGRIQIFREYWKRLNWSGHKKMGFSTDTMPETHAHNSYLQNAYDFGIHVGIMWLILTIGMLMRAIYQIWVGKDRSEMMFAVLLMSAAFILVSLTEYVSNPCMPLCFAMLFLLITMRTDKNVVK